MIEAILKVWEDEKFEMKCLVKYLHHDDAETQDVDHIKKELGKGNAELGERLFRNLRSAARQ